jgi:hypothetical protein
MIYIDVVLVLYYSCCGGHRAERKMKERTELRGAQIKSSKQTNTITIPKIPSTNSSKRMFNGNDLQECSRSRPAAARLAALCSVHQLRRRRNRHCGVTSATVSARGGPGDADARAALALHPGLHAAAEAEPAHGHRGRRKHDHDGQHADNRAVGPPRRRLLCSGSVRRRRGRDECGHCPRAAAGRLTNYWALGYVGCR